MSLDVADLNFLLGYTFLRQPRPWCLTLQGETKRLPFLRHFKLWVNLFDRNTHRDNGFARFPVVIFVQRKSFGGEKFRELRGFGAIRESFNRENFHRVRRPHYQWACHCRFPQFANFKVLIAKTRLSAIRESFHTRKTPAIRQLWRSQFESLVAGTKHK